MDIFCIIKTPFFPMVISKVYKDFHLNEYKSLLEHYKYLMIFYVTLFSGVLLCFVFY